MKKPVGNTRFAIISLCFPEFFLFSKKDLQKTYAQRKSPSKQFSLQQNLEISETVFDGILVFWLTKVSGIWSSFSMSLVSPVLQAFQCGFLQALSYFQSILPMEATRLTFPIYKYHLKLFPSNLSTISAQHILITS